MGDPWEHLEWETVNFQDFVNHVTDMLAETTWQENIQYPGSDSEPLTEFIHNSDFNPIKTRSQSRKHYT